MNNGNETFRFSKERTGGEFYWLHSRIMSTKDQI